MLSKPIDTGLSCLKSDGKLGIGTTAPDAKLDIYSSGPMIQMENSLHLNFLLV